MLLPHTKSADFGVFFTHYIRVVNKFYRGIPIFTKKEFAFLFPYNEPIFDWIEKTPHRTKGWKYHRDSYIIDTSKYGINHIYPYDHVLDYRDNRGIIDTNIDECKLPEIDYNVDVVISPRFSWHKENKNYPIMWQKLIDSHPQAVICCLKSDLTGLTLGAENRFVEPLNEICAVYKKAGSVITVDSGLGQCATYCNARLTIITNVDLKVGYSRFVEYNPNFQGYIKNEDYGFTGY